MKIHFVLTALTEYLSNQNFSKIQVFANAVVLICFELFFFFNFRENYRENFRENFRENYRENLRENFRENFRECFREEL